jgi:hypothetical protein
VLGSIATFGVSGAFNSTTNNAGNDITSGNVTIGDNDAGSALYYLPSAIPGDSVTKCIKVTYTGSVRADVSLYTHDNALGLLAPYVNLTITQGTQTTSTFPSCTGFTPSSGGGILYSGTLQNFSTTRTSLANGIPTNPVSAAIGWNQGDALVYQFQVTLDASTPDSAEAATTAAHGFIWEADSF